MSMRAIVVSLFVCAALDAAAALIFGWSFGRAVTLAPVVVVVAGAAAFLGVLWMRMAIGPRRRR